MLSNLEHASVVALVGGIGVGKSSLLHQEVSAALTARQLWPYPWAPGPIGDLTWQLENFVTSGLRRLPRPVVLLPTIDLGPDDIPQALRDSGVRVVATSRHGSLWSPPDRIVRIGVFTRSQSIEYLTHSVRGLSDRDAEQAAEYLDDIPLALAHAIPFLRRGLSVENFLRLSREYPAFVFDEKTIDDYSSSLLAEYEKYLSALAPPISPLSLDLLGALAVMRGKPFTVPNPSTQPQNSLWRPAVLTLPADRQPPAPYRIRKEYRSLERHGLVQQFEDHFEMTALKSDLTLFLFGADLLPRVSGIAESMLLNRLPVNEGEVKWSDRARWAECLEPLLAVDPVNMVSLQSRFCLLGAAGYLLLQGRYREAYDRLSALRTSWRAGQPNSPGVPLQVRLRLLDLLSQAARRIEDPRAWRYAATAYRCRRQLQGEHHPDTISSALTMLLAIPCTDRGRPLLAALTVLLESAEAGQHDQLAHRIRSLKAAVRLAFRHTVKPVNELLEILGAQTGFLGADHPDTLSTLHQLAFAYAESGQDELAKQRFEAAVAGRTAALGKQHPDTLASVEALEAHLRGAPPPAHRQFW
ncbi:tetratricopeptide repeat protein [Kitasatospora sp. NPDC057198]|uniref:tetratricopeptide repeat protein n=1 Tax=Kitasatospora sp. NPDC057198 TaxID=3346046 RepID=UPI003625667C